MKWKADDVLTYSKAKEYVDTAVIPLVPLKWGKSEKETVSMGEFAVYISEYLEKQFTGRVFLLPPFTYLTDEKTADRVSRLVEWDKYFYENGFSHIIYVTADVTWKAVDKQLPDELIWIPASSTESENSSRLNSLINQQIQQIVPLFTAKWQAGPVPRD